MSEELIQHALKIFDSQARSRQPPGLALLGPPGSGKSIFLNNLMNTLNRRDGSFATRSLMLDLRNIPIGSELEIYFHINQALRQEAARIGIDQDFDIDVQKASLRFDEILRALLGAVDGHLVIFIDHLESVPRLFASNLSHRFRSFLETTEQDSEYLRLGFIIAGAVSLYDLKHGPNSAFQQLQVIHFPQSERSTQVELVEDYLKNSMSPEISPELLNLFADLTAGEPGFLEPLMIHLLRDGKQISLTEELVLRAVKDICCHSQTPALRNLALHLWGDYGLREIVRDLAKLPSVMPRSAAPDIDRYELSGAVVVGRGPYGKSREYKFRNGIAKYYLSELYKILETDGYKPSSEFSVEKELRKLEIAKAQCLNASQIWSWMNAVRDAWVAITPYNRPKLYLYVAKIGSPSGWWLDADFGTVSDAEIREPSDFSTKTTTFAALDQLSLAFSGDTENVRAFFGTDPDHISIAIPLRPRDLALIIVATLSRTDAYRGLTEFDLCHWIQFVQNVKHSVSALALAELGQKLLLSGDIQETDCAKRTKGIATRHIYLLPDGEAIVNEPRGVNCISGAIKTPDVDDLNGRCLELVDHWTDHQKFEKGIRGIGNQLATALDARFPELAKFLVADPMPEQMVIASNAEGLKIPFELFPHARSHLTLLTGITRQIMGHQLRPELCFSFDHLLRSLVKQKQDLRVLLVASYPDGQLSKPGEELNRVRQHIEVGCGQMNLRVRFVEVVPEEATVQRVESELLDHGPYHVFHYSGHGRHFTEERDASGIALLGENGEYEVVKCNRLRRWFAAARSWLVYLSCCHSSASSGTNQDLSSRYVGTIDATVAAGVPNIVGFRCRVSDESALHLADEFYRYLFTVQKEKHLSQAMLAARQKVESRADLFDAWASSMLITQYS